MAAVVFYFDCATAESHLAAARLAETALRTGAAIDWRPVLPGDLEPLPVVTEAERRYIAKDLADWARFCGVPLNPGGAPASVAEVAAHYLATLAGRAERGRAAAAWFAAVHGDGPADPLALAASAGQLPEAVAAASVSPVARATLAANAASLRDVGGWRLPAFVVGDELFVGHERVSLVELALTQASERRLVPPGAHSQGVAEPAPALWTAADPSGKVRP